MIFIGMLALMAYSYHFVSVGSDESIISAIESIISNLDSSNTWTIYSDSNDFRKNNDQIIDFLILFGISQVGQEEFLKFVEETDTLTLIFGFGENTERVFYLENTPECTTSVIKAFITYQKLNKIVLLEPFSITNQEIYKHLKLEALNVDYHILINDKNSLLEMKKILINIFKSNGLQNFLILPHGSLCYLISQAFTLSKLDVSGNLGVFLDECIYQSNINGTVFLVPLGLENTKSRTEYISKKIAPFFSVFIEPNKNKFDLSKKLMKKVSNCQYSVVNLINGERKIVGNILRKNIYINESIFFYGGLSDRSDFSKARIVISANTGTFNPLGAPETFANKKYHEGTYFAVEKINRDHLFPNHNFYLYDKVDCGIIVFDSNYSKSCILKHIPNMGSAYIPTVTFINANFLTQLYQLEIKIPFIAGILSAGILSNKTAYPTFVRIVSPSSSFSSAWSNLITKFGWKKIVMHYANDSFGISAYTTLNKSAELRNYEIINDEKYRMINNILSNSSIPNYYEHMKNTISLGCNIIFLGMGDPSSFFWLEGMYDMGARRGDYTFIFFTTTGLDAFNQPTGNAKKRRELMHGSLVMYNAAWVGEYGKNTEKEFLQYRNITWGRSYNIDAVYAAAKTSEYLLSRGESHEDNQVFNIAMRNIRFLGVTGIVSFDSTSNDRNMFYFNIFNFFEDSNGNWHNDAVSLISPLGTVYYQTLNPITWPAGVKPTDMKKNYANCKFQKQEIRESGTSKMVKIVLSTFLLLFATIFSVCVLKKLNHFKIELMNKKSYAIFQDYITIGFIFIESIQIISVGPSFEEFNQMLSKICEAISLNYLKVEYWIVFLSLFIATICWILLLALSYINSLCGKIFLQRYLETFKEYSIPFMSNYLFIPIISSLFTILMCDNSTGSDITDSYMNYDCNMKCWKSPHIFLAVIASILIISYVPVAIYYRTIWQIENNLLNIRVNTTYLVVKNINVLTIIVIAKVVKLDYRFIHSILFICLQVCMIVFLLVLKTPFNYDRANLWSKTMGFCIVWNSFVCILSSSVYLENFKLVILQMIGWIAVFAIAVFLHFKLPVNLLVSKKGIEIKELFQYEFGRKSAKETIYAYKDKNFENGIEADNK